MFTELHLWAGQLNMAEFPLMRRMDSCWNSPLSAFPSGEPVCLAKAPPSFLTLAAAFSCYPPRLSISRGINAIPHNPSGTFPRSLASSLGRPLGRGWVVVPVMTGTCLSMCSSMCPSMCPGTCPSMAQSNGSSCSDDLASAHNLMAHAVPMT